MSDVPASPVPGARGYHRTVQKAVDLIWNNQGEEAERILSTKKDTNPRWALEWANCMCIRGLMSASNEVREAMLDRFQHADGLATKTKYTVPEEDEDDIDALLAAAEQDHALNDKERERIRKEREKALEKQREKDKDNFKKGGDRITQNWKLECDVIYADALMVRSVVQLTLNSYFRGGVNLRKTWGCFYALQQEVEKDSEGAIPREIAMAIKYGCGVFYAYLALVPAGLMKLLSAIGFISDKELGEQYLTEVFQSDTIRTPQAALVLCTYYLFLPTGLGDVKATLAKAKVVLDKMNEKYPNNSYFWGYLNFYHRKLGHTAEAVDAITKASRNAEAAGQKPTLLTYLYGDTLYMDLQWDNARVQYEKLLQHLENTGDSFAYTGQVVISLAACYVMLGDTESAMRWLKRVNSMFNPKSKQDANSPKYAARVLKEPRLLPLMPIYVLYINRDLAHMEADHVEKLRESTAAILKTRDSSEPETEAMYNLFDGVMKKNTGKTDDARYAFALIFAKEKRLAKDSLVLPYAYYEQGELEYRAGNYQEAKALFEKGCGLQGDGHETLANRYAIAQKQLKREMKEKGLA